MNTTAPTGGDQLYPHDIAAIRASRAASNQAIVKKDVAGAARFWADDFVQIAGDGSRSAGKKKIVKEWTDMFSHSSPVFERLPEEIIISSDGKSAWERGKWVYKNDIYHGSYAAMWHKIRGVWLTRYELYVSLN